MAIVRCKNGHYYNDSDSPNCPYCSGESAIGRTIPLSGAASGGFPKTTMETVPPTGPTPNQTTGNFRPTENLGYQPTAPIGGGGANIPRTEAVGGHDIGRTEIIDRTKNSEITPVRGWLVVIDGEKLGLDFKVHSGRNYVGRAKSNDICFDFDATVSKEKGCVITYDERTNSFYIQPGEGTNNVYLNDGILLQASPLKDDDVIEIGKTKLIFRALCNGNFKY